ncbi:MAG: hypothetical protein J6D57_04190 [Mogibacterium sp.]|nr:hypothetical protein [Mogibacterium sp.]
MGLSLVEGRLSDRYNHFAEYEFESCQATDTRLMGVVAMKITWRGRDKARARYFQVIHLDYSEYGIDEYLEFECIPGTDTYKDNKEDMNYYWQHFTGVMGGKVVSIPAETMMKLIEMALPLASEGIDREYDDDENREFRAYAVMRLGFMKKELERHGYSAEGCGPEAAMRAVTPQKLATCETINYFIMRLVDRDFDAAAMLSYIDRSELEKSELAEAGIQTLVRSRIKKSDQEKDVPADGKSFPYRCRITTLGRDGYYHATFVIYLSGDYRSKDPFVTQLDIGSVVRLSEYESAIQVARREYITVFECPDNILNGFDGRNIAPLISADQSIVPNGWLYTIYNKDNSHVNKSDYRLGDDVYGYALLSIGGEFVLMSNEMTRISMLDNATAMSLYAPYLKLSGRFMIETPIFHTLCHTHGAYFADLIEQNPES